MSVEMPYTTSELIITEAFLFRLYDVSAPCQVFQYICANILIIIRYYIYEYIYEMRIIDLLIGDAMEDTTGIGSGRIC